MQQFELLFELLFEQQSVLQFEPLLVLLLELLLEKLCLILFGFGFAELLLGLYKRKLSFAHLPIIVHLL